MMLAIIGAAILLDRQFAGLISGYLLWFFPMPMVFYSARYGWKDSLMVLSASCLMTLLFGMAFSSFYVISTCVIGWAYGSGVHAGMDSRKVLFITMALSVVMEFLAAYVFAGIIGYDIAAEMKEYETIMESFSGVSGGVDLQSIISVKSLFVMSLVLLGIMEGYVTHMIAKIMMARLRLPRPKTTPVREWFPPVWSGYIAIAGLVLYQYLLYHPFANEALQAAGQTAGFFSTLYLAFIGLIGMWIVLPARNPAARGWLLPLSVLMLMLMLFLSIFGFLYITTDMHEKALKGAH